MEFKNHNKRKSSCSKIILFTFQIWRPKWPNCETLTNNWKRVKRNFPKKTQSYRPKPKKVKDNLKKWRRNMNPISFPRKPVRKIRSNCIKKRSKATYLRLIIMKHLWRLLPIIFKSNRKTTKLWSKKWTKQENKCKPVKIAT